MGIRHNETAKMTRSRLSKSKLLLVTAVVLTIVTAVGYANLSPATTSAYAATPITVAFDFDTGSPPPSLYQNTPFDYLTSSGVAAHFSSTSDLVTPAFSVQSSIPTGYNLSMFSGQWLYDNQLTRDYLDIKFNAHLYSINLTFATIEQHGGPGIEPCYINLTAYMDSAGTTPVGWTWTRGVTASEQNTQGTLSFNSGGQPFNLVRIGIPVQPAPKPVTDFFVDNIVITATLLDTTPPVTAISLSGTLGNQGWYTSNVAVNLSATDDATGVAQIYYRINSGTVKTVSADGQPLITQEKANNTLEYWSIDNMGNEETHHLLTDIKLDKTPPTIGVPTRTPETDVWPGQQVKILVNVTDSTSGSANVTLSYSLDNGTTWLPSMNMNFNASTRLHQATIPPQPDGTWIKYKIEAADSAGNQAVNDNAGLFYNYHVVPEFPFAIILPLFIAVTTLAIFIAKRKLPRDIHANTTQTPLDEPHPVSDIS